MKYQEYAVSVFDNYIKENKADLILDFFLILTIIYNSNSVWALASDQFALSCFALFGVSLIYYLHCLTQKKYLLQKTLVPLLIVACATIIAQLAISLAHNGEGLLNGSWIQLTFVLPLLVGSMLVRGKEYVYDIFLPRVVKISSVLCGLSILFWMLCNFVGMPPVSQTRLNWTSGDSIGSYYNLFYQIQSISFGSSNLWRNVSVFPESPQAAVFYGLMLGIDLLLMKKTNYLCAIILSVGLFTTLSTSAYLYLLFLWFPFLFIKLINNSNKNEAKVLISALLIVFICISCVAIRIVSSKISGSYSGMTHLTDITEGVRIWLDNPVFGFGFESDDYIWSHYVINYRGGMGYTSGLIFCLLHGGIPLFLVYIIPIVFLYISNNNVLYKIFAIYLLFIYITVIVQNYGLFIYCLSLGYVFFIWRK